MISLKYKYQQYYRDFFVIGFIDNIHYICSSIKLKNFPKFYKSISFEKASKKWFSKGKKQVDSVKSKHFILPTVPCAMIKYIDLKTDFAHTSGVPTEPSFNLRILWPGNFYE